MNGIELQIPVKFVFMRQQELMLDKNGVNGIETSQSEDIMHSGISVGCRPSQTVTQQLHQLTQNISFVNFRVCSLNVRHFVVRLEKI